MISKDVDEGLGVLKMIALVVFGHCKDEVLAIVAAPLFERFLLLEARLVKREQGELMDAES